MDKPRDGLHVQPDLEAMVTYMKLTHWSSHLQLLLLATSLPAAPALLPDAGRGGACRGVVGVVLLVENLVDA